jgi:hypothetical protein
MYHEQKDVPFLLVHLYSSPCLAFLGPEGYTSELLECLINLRSILASFQLEATCYPFLILLFVYHFLSTVSFPFVLDSLQRIRFCIASLIVSQTTQLTTLV